LIVGGLFLSSRTKVEPDGNLQKKFAVTEHKPIVVVIPSYNNFKWCKKNLSSALKQDYDNFRIVYIDDASTDGTSERIQDYIKRKDKSSRVSYIRNETNQGAIGNLYRVIHQCQNHEIVVILDGDDWLAHESVLTKINEAYADPDVWMTYGNYVEYPTYNKNIRRQNPISEKIVRENLYRNYELAPFRMRTFFAGLYKRIALHDFLKEGKFYEACSCMAIILPLLEMAGEHAKFIKDVLLIYNHGNPLNHDKVRLETVNELDNYIRSLPRYDRLPHLGKGSGKKEKADLVVFSYNRPMQLYAFLESLHKYVSGLEQKTVIYRSSSDVYEKAYGEVKNSFPSVRFIPEGSDSKNNFRHLTLREVFESPSRYIVFAVDDIVLKESFDIGECTEALAKTGAYGFFLKLGKAVDYCYTLNKHQGIPDSIPCGTNLFAWQFEAGECDWKYPNSLDFTLYKKDEIRACLSKLDFHNPNTFEAAWARKADMRKVGLYFKNSKMINIPINLVNDSFSNRCMNSCSAEELLYKFNAGLKIDISPYHQMNNRSVHTEAPINFISREHEH
jgi:glycosyltransferase involved in cell wall biosynthesis